MLLDYWYMMCIGHNLDFTPIFSMFGQSQQLGKEVD